MQQSFQTPSAIELYVELGSGRITTHTTATGETVVEVTGPRADEFHVVHNGNQVSVISPKSRVGFFSSTDSHQVSVTLPGGSDLITKAGSADTVASGSYGIIKLKTGSGDVEIDEADGPVVVESGSGDVRAGEIRGELRIKSGSGDIDLGELGGNVGISTGSGDVTIGRTRSRAVVKTGSGDLEVKRADTDVTLSTASGDLTIGSASKGAISAKNVSGDVRVGIPAGTPVWTDITSTTGRVRSDLRSVGAPEEGQNYVEVRATTVSGDIHLTHV